MSTSIVLAIFILLILLGFWGSDGLPLPYRQRSCQGKGWMECFPEASKDEIRDFLQVFVDAFAFKTDHRLKFHPMDPILDTYKALYPQRWMPDALELETLAEDIQERYGIDLATHWQDTLTLGELFTLCHPQLPDTRTEAVNRQEC